MGTHVVPYIFNISDGATAATGATMPLVGLPDTADTFQYPIVKGCKIVGIGGSGGPASGDTVQLQPLVAGATIAAAVQVTLTSALPQACTWLGPNDSVSISNISLPALLACRYTTGTTGTYGTKDVQAVIYVEYDDD